MLRTVCWNAPVVKQFGSANSSIVIVVSQVASAAWRRSGLAMAMACGGIAAIRSHHAIGGLHQVLGCDDFLHQPDVEGATGRQWSPARKERERTLIAQPPGQRPRRADLRHQSEPAERGHDQRLLRRQDHVAGQRPGQSDSGRWPVDRRDERGVAAGDEPCDAAEFVPDPTPDVGRALGVAEMLLGRKHHLQVTACAETAARAGQYHSADGWIRRKFGQRLLRLPHQRRAQHVQALGLVEHDHRTVLAAGDLDEPLASLRRPRAAGPDRYSHVLLTKVLFEN